jgi:hypothetical protein
LENALVDVWELSWWEQAAEPQLDDRLASMWVCSSDSLILALQMIFTVRSFPKGRTGY